MTETPTASKFIWMSDPHFVAEGLVQGHDSRLRLTAAIEWINDHHGNAAFCLISGDMVNRGTDADYAALAEMLEDLTIPYLPLTGNHDNRAPFRRYLKLPETGMGDFIQYDVLFGGAQILCLDTLKEGAGGGELCAARRTWLYERLGRPEPTLVFMHHPPLALGLPMQDRDRLAHGESLIDAMAASGKVSFLGAGHVHRPLSGSIRGIPYATLGSILYQAPPPVPAWDWSTFHPAAEAPRLAVVMVEGDDICLHHEQICPFETGVAHL
ncbi:MAG: metallophosphoesterase [Pseudomonadota bacterium]